MQDGKLLWEPPAALREHSHMARFAAALGAADYDALWRRSVEDIEGFWAAIWERFDAGGAFDRVLADPSMPGAVWFPGTTLNYAERLFRGKPDERVAIHFASERDALGEWTWGQLRERTAAIRAGLVARGVGRGDRVAAYLPNVPDTIAAFLATASLGAVWSSAAPEFGARSVCDRFGQIEPKVLLAVDGYRYGGKDFDKRAAVDGDRRGDRRARRAAAALDGRLGGRLPPRRPRSSSSRSRSTTRCGSCTRPAPPGCPRRSSRGRAGSCSST